jgi:WD40 repeat protein
MVYGLDRYRILNTYNRALVYPLFLRDVGRYYWNPKTLQEHMTVLSFTNGSYKSRLAFSADNTRFACGNTGSPDLQIYELKTGRLLHTLKPPVNYRLKAFCFSPNGRFLARGFERSSFDIMGAIIIWDMETDIHIKKFPAYGVTVEGLRYSPCGRYLVITFGNATIEIRDTQTWACIRRIQNAHETISMDYSSDGKWLVDCTVPGELRLLNMETFEYTHLADSSSDAKIRVYWSPNGQQIVTFRWGGNADIWDVRDISKPKIIKQLKNRVYCGCFSPCGKKFITVSTQDRGIQFWNTKTWQCSRVVGCDTLGSVTCSSDGKFLLTSSFLGLVTLYRL